MQTLLMRAARPILLGLLAVTCLLIPAAAADRKPNIVHIATAEPGKAAAMQHRLNELGKEAAKPLALIYVASVGPAHGKPVIAPEDSPPPAEVNPHGPSIADEGVGDPELHP